MIVSDLNVIIQVLLTLMVEAGKKTNLRGHEKKLYVLNKLLKHPLMENEYSRFVSDMIDLLVKVEKGKLVINPVIRSCKCCSML